MFIPEDNAISVLTCSIDVGRKNIDKTQKADSLLTRGAAWTTKLSGPTAVLGKQTKPGWLESPQELRL